MDGLIVIGFKRSNGFYFDLNFLIGVVARVAPRWGQHRPNHANADASENQ